MGALAFARAAPFEFSVDPASFGGSVEIFASALCPREITGSAPASPTITSASEAASAVERPSTRRRRRTAAERVRGRRRNRPIAP